MRKRGDPQCILCRGARMWWPAALRRCPFHGVAAQHHVCAGCANAHGLGERGFFRMCPKDPMLKVVLALMAEEGK